MKRFLLVAILLTQALLVSAQKPEIGPPAFDIADFNKKFEVAEWLVRYDTVAWKTTDLLMKQGEAELARLGPEWFAFEDDKGQWHAVYGKLENNKFDLVTHFVVQKSDGKITRTTEKLDEAFLVSHARALSTAQAKLKEKLPADSPRHNQYVKRNADKSFAVWLLPAFQPNSVAVFGGEFIYTIDAAGEKVIKDESYFQGDFRGFKSKPPREIWLKYPEKEKPTLGSIFFVWYYKEYFTSIFIDNAKSTSTVIKDGRGGYMWVHVEKDKKPADPPK